MQVDALVCDAVSIREGLAHILGGGVTRVVRTQYPGPCGVSVAVLLTLVGEERNGHHVLQVALRQRHEEPIAEMKVDFSVQLTAESEEFSMICMPFRFSAVQLPEAGQYTFAVLVNGKLERELPFKAVAYEALPAKA